LPWPGYRINFVGTLAHVQIVASGSERILSQFLYLLGTKGASFKIRFSGGYFSQCAAHNLVTAHVTRSSGLKRKRYLDIHFGLILLLLGQL